MKRVHLETWLASSLVVLFVWAGTAGQGAGAGRDLAPPRTYHAMGKLNAKADDLASDWSEGAPKVEVLVLSRHGPGPWEVRGQGLRLLVETRADHFLVDGAWTDSPLALPHGSWLVRVGGVERRYEASLRFEVGTLGPLPNEDGGSIGSSGDFPGMLRGRGRGPRVLATIPLERYVAGVVASESEAGTPQEALRALAVVARSYALAEGARHEDGHLCDLAHCQVMAGILPSPLQKRAENAARETAGWVLQTQGGRIARTPFHGACGGHTGDPAQIFGGPPTSGTATQTLRVREKITNSREAEGGANEEERPLALARGKKIGPALAGTISSHALSDARAVGGEIELRPVTVERASGGGGAEETGAGAVPDPGCALRRWAVSVPRGQVERALAEAFRFPVSADSVEVETGRGGFVWRLRDKKTGRTALADSFVRGLDRDLGWGVVRSSRFRMDVQGEVVRLEGTGLGHGIGLCQEGAARIARQGARHGEILRHYFPNAQLARRESLGDLGRHEQQQSPPSSPR